MKAGAHSRFRLGFGLVLAALVCCSTYAAPRRALGDPIPQPSGSYGFLISSIYANPLSDVGGVVLGVMSIDDAGNVTGSYTIQLGGTDSQDPQTMTGALSGAYTGNADGTGSLAVSLDVGIDLTFATVVSGGGQYIRSRRDVRADAILRGR